MKKLNSNDLINLQGGISVEEYCATVSMLIQNNWDTWTDEQRKAAANAYSTHC